ncbi:MAG: SpoIIIAH-like family protein [Clostridia bacterium]|nr:SpoIIIAH-like family protein [Clostridia bacterium]
MKRIAEALSGCFCALVVACALLYSVGTLKYAPFRSVETISYNEKEYENPKEYDNPIEAFHREREEVRRLEVLQLNAVINDESANEDIRNEARRLLIDISRYMEAETAIEGVLALRGFTQNAVTVSANSVNVVIGMEALTQKESAQIMELVMRETGFSGGNVKIMAAGASWE